MNKKIIWIIVFLAFVIVVNGTCPPDCSTKDSITTNTYSEEDAYSNPDFFKNSDPALWNWNYINGQNWKNINWKDAKVQDAINTNPNAADRYLNMSGCGSCSFYGYNNKVTFSADGMIKHQNGDTLTAINYPEGTIFEVTSTGFIVTLPHSEETFSIPSTDTITLDTKEFDINLLGKNIPPGVRVNGKIIFKNGNAYLPSGQESVIINNVMVTHYIPGAGGELNPPDSPTQIFFDGKPHNKANNYVSLNPSTGEMVMNSNYEGSTVSVTFNENNPFIYVEKDDIVIAECKHNTEIKITNNERKGNIPSLVVTATNSKKYDFWIRSGKVFIGGSNYGITTNVESINARSSPMEIKIFDYSGKSLLGDKENPQKIIVSNFNELVTIPIDQESGMTRAGFEVSSRLSIAYPTVQEIAKGKAIIIPGNPSQKEIQEIIALTPPGQIVIIGTDDPVVVRETLTMIGNMPPDVRASIKGIEILSDEEWKEREKEVYGSVGQTGGGYASSNGVITLSMSAFRENIMKHEAAHERVFSLIEQDSDFSKEWNNVAGDVYGKDLGEKMAGGNKLSLYWVDGKNEPRNGCVKAYGCNNLQEDVATTVEFIYKSPYYFRELVNPENSEYNPIYREKIDLLCSYGFVDGNIYKEVTGEERTCMGDAG